MSLILPVRLSWIRPVLTLENPGTDDPALPLPTSPSVPRGDAPKRNKAKKREQAQDMEAGAHA